MPLQITCLQEASRFLFARHCQRTLKRHECRAPLAAARASDHSFRRLTLRSATGTAQRVVPTLLKAGLRTLLAAFVLGFGVAAAGTGRVDLTRLQCGNLIYAGNKSSVCFSDKFLSDVARDTSLNVGRNFCPVKLDADGLFDYPFCVCSGNESFTLTQKERDNLRKYLSNGGFLLASPGCSDEKWDAAFRKELKICFPESKLVTIPMSHPLFSVVNKLTRLTDKHGVTVMLEGLEINGRLAVVYSKEGLNDVAHAEGCCCCGGNEITDPAKVNVNIFTYALLY